MPAFAEWFCGQKNCAPADFRRKIFWLTLHRHAVPLAPLLLRGNYFESDRDLIDAGARATSLRQVHDEISIHPGHAYHGGWLRRHAKLRISTQRLRRLAARCFAGS